MLIIQHGLMGIRGKMKSPGDIEFYILNNIIQLLNNADFAIKMHSLLEI